MNKESPGVATPGLWFEHSSRDDYNLDPAMVSLAPILC